MVRNECIVDFAKVVCSCFHRIPPIRTDSEIFGAGSGSRNWFCSTRLFSEWNIHAEHNSRITSGLSSDVFVWLELSIIRCPADHNLFTTFWRCSYYRLLGVRALAVQRFAYHLLCCAGGYLFVFEHISSNAIHIRNVVVRATC